MSIAAKRQRQYAERDRATAESVAAVEAEQKAAAASTEQPKQPVPGKYDTATGEHAEDEPAVDEEEVVEDGPDEDADTSEDEPEEEARPRKKRSKSKKHRRA